MEQKFVSFDDALVKLAISSDKLNELRERGELRAYRDGSSWKFRADEIDRMANTGIPELPPPSDISLIDMEDLVDAEPIDNPDEDTFGLGLAELEEEVSPAPEPDESSMDLKLADTDAISTGSELELAGLEDTVTAGASDLSLDLPDEPSDPTDSILLSEEELGESVTGSLSTIIGRKELEHADSDLDLELSDDVTDDEDTKLSPSSGASNVLSTQVAGSGVLDDNDDPSDAKRRFEDIEELEIDLAAESSLALNPGEFAEAREGSQKSLTAKKSDSDLTLGDEEPEDENNMGSTDVPLEEKALAGLQGDADPLEEFELAGDEDLILSDAEGSDITLDSGSSGINIVSPSDSGLALDDMPLDISGSAILSSLSLEGSDPEISLLGSNAGMTQGSSAELQTGDDFQLTPLSEGGLDDGDSSSQVIALDADLGGFGGDSAGLLEEDAFAEEGGGLSEDFGPSPASDLGMGGYAGVAVAPAAADSMYSLGNILLLMAPALFLMLGGIMILDIIRHIWSWQEPYTITSSLLEGLLGMFGLN